MLFGFDIFTKRLDVFARRVSRILLCVSQLENLLVIATAVDICSFEP